MGYPHELQFNTGVSLYFKAYSQNVQHLQAGTVHAMFTDEEVPEDIFSELMFRLAATDGYFHMVFTATLGQDFWRRAIERKGFPDEALKSAWKRQVSMYDCLKYEDGSPTPWTEKRISEIKNKCKSEAEVLRRVYGRFIRDEGLKYPCFSRSRNFVPPYKIPTDWLIYSGVDIGGGGKGHPAAIIFVAVRPDFQKAAVFRGWRGNNSVVTTASDILEKYRMLRGSLKPVMQCYDWASKDFFSYATRLGETFTKADKDHALGEDVINVLFKNRILDIFDIEELQDLAYEFESLSHDALKRFAHDDFIDALRYAITRIPFDWTCVADDLVGPEKKPKKELTDAELRRQWVFEDAYKEQEEQRVEAEIGEYNELYGY
jgi:phage terminase large subunit-like protein